MAAKPQVQFDLPMTLTNLEHRGTECTEVDLFSVCSVPLCSISTNIKNCMIVVVQALIYKAAFTIVCFTIACPLAFKVTIYKPSFKADKSTGIVISPSIDWIICCCTCLPYKS